jgi:hypothetical protein
MKQSDIEWNLQTFACWKDKIDYNKTSISPQNN